MRTHERDGTFAWFTANSTAATKVNSAAQGTIGTASDALATSYWIKGVWEAGSTDANAAVDANENNVTLSLTDSAGATWTALRHGDADGDGVKDDGETWSYTAAAATASNAKYGRLKLSFHVYNNSDCADEHEVTGADNLKAVDGTYTFYVTSSQSRLRFSKTNAAGSYSTAYGTDIEVTVTISAGVISDDLTELFYSFGGNASANGALSEGATIAEADVDTSAPSGTIECKTAAY